MNPSVARRPIPWGLIFGAWTAYGVVQAAEGFINYQIRGTPVLWWQPLLAQLPQAFVWALATPGIMWLGRRFPIVGPRWPQHVALHLLISVSFVFLQDVGYAYHISNIWPSPRPVMAMALQLFVVWALSDGMLYWMVLVVTYAVDHYRRFRERELTAAQLETQLAQADLQALKMQLQPHFLYNALHTIGSLVRTGDRENAVRVVAGLGGLLRLVLDHAAQQEVPLKQELDFIRSYLEIEQIRFRDRLQVTIQAEPDVLDAKVPHLILQPLVENAIRHGIAPHLFASKVTVAARRTNSRLELVVRDDGPGTGVGDTARPGIGLSNTRARLTRLYGDDFGLAVENAAGGGLEARLELPFALAPVDWVGEA